MVFNKLGKSAPSDQWNISGELCSGRAIDDTSIYDTNYNPLIKCDCSYDNATTCRITELYTLYLSLSQSINLNCFTSNCYFCRKKFLNLVPVSGQDVMLSKLGALCNLFNAHLFACCLLFLQQNLCIGCRW